MHKQLLLKKSLATLFSLFVESSICTSIMYSNMHS
ncbi:hypothetical protein Taro_044882 [Colocasia esculenta]|uniref:Uncharacterized protein n=1 Tax=Colocasia esculenta TaxID=4460 RepID=A0A843X1P3_COLES|nr:hypothetical protein [Colocasia esculenta]